MFLLDGGMVMIADQRAPGRTRAERPRRKPVAFIDVLLVIRVCSRCANGGSLDANT
jgi:hypothetical protein